MVSGAGVRWGIVVFAREPAQLVLANIGWHLGSGAAQVHLFLDDPADPVAAVARNISGCTVTLCDDSFWKAMGHLRRPEKQTRCQGIIYDHVYQKTQLDWLLPLDADELLFQHTPLADELAAQPGATYALRLHNLERVMIRGQVQEGILDGVFRRPLLNTQFPAHAPRGNAARFLRRGFAGYSNGKSVLRRGASLHAAVHTPRMAPGAATAPLSFAKSSEILHFDGLTRAHWLAKIQRYGKASLAMRRGLIGDHRVAQTQAIEACNEVRSRAEGFHDLIKTVSPGQARDLVAADLIFAPSLKPEQVISAGLRGPCPDLTAAAFDAILSK